MKGQEQNPEKWIEKVIADFVRSSENTLQNKTDNKAWADPLVGFSRGDDPLYQEYKQHVGPFHFTPLEIFNKTFPRVQVSADQLTVISWILPQTERTKEDLRRETVYPAESWARARIFGEDFNVKLRLHVVKTLMESGVEAVSPFLSSFYETKNSERYGAASNWSERHAAYASGLGTFGLCDGLITAKGKAMRCGSAVARIYVPPTPRPYADPRAYCLFFSRGICKKCIARCPAGAVTEAGHDKTKCRAYVRETGKYVKDHFGFDGYGCGFCQTGVPCESKIPTGE